MEKYIRIGDTVAYRSSFGYGRITSATVTHIEKTSSPFEKYGESVQQVLRSEADCAVFDLDNGHWIYGDQLAAEEVRA